jgi:hypothetical protein
LVFLEAHNGIVQLLDAVAGALQTIRKGEWERWWGSWSERYREYLDVLRRHRFDVTTFLVEHGREEPQTAGRAVTYLIATCAQARQVIDRTPWGDLDLVGVRDAVAAGAEPVLQTLRLHAHELEKRLQDLTERAEDVPPGNARTAPPAPEPEWTKADNVLDIGEKCESEGMRLLRNRIGAR